MQDKSTFYLYRNISSNCYCNIRLILTLMFASFIVPVSGKVETKGPDGYSGVLSFGDDMNDEGDFSEHMPDELKCDACVLIAQKLAEKFLHTHKKRPSLQQLPESELLDLVDEVCHDKFENYGVKQVRGVKRLSGPGMEVNHLPGVLQAGGKWPQRIMKMCKMYMGEIGEDEIYRIYKKYESLENYLCFGSGVRGSCLRPPRKGEL